MMQLNIYSLPLLLGIGLLLFLMFLVRQRNQGRVVTFFMVFSSLVVIYSLLFVAQLLAGSPDLQIFIFHLMVFFALFIPMVTLFFTLEYLGYDTWINWKSMTLLLIFPALAGVLELTNPLHGLFWQDVSIIYHDGFSYVKETAGFIPIILSIYLYFVLGFSLAFLLLGMMQIPRHRRKELSILVVAMVVPLLFDLIRIFELNPWPFLYITPYGVLLSVLLLGVSVTRYNFLNVIPAAYSRLFTEVSDATLVLDHKQNLLDFNNAAVDMVTSPEHPLPESLVQLPKPLREVLAEQRTELHLETESGEQFFDVRYSNLMESDGALRAVVVTLHDITWRKQAEEQLQQLIEEKEVLLREINHRVKNNFNLAGSLLFLEAQKFQDSAVQQAFEVSRDRLRTMSLLNERLYRTESFNNLDLGAYLTAISEDLISVQMPRDIMVELTCETEEIFVGPREAIPCGLIVNELVTNSLKYAFKDKVPERPQVFVRLHRGKDNLIHLQVADNGGGYPETMDYESSKTLGMRLVLMLGQDQLGGMTTISSENGAVFSLSFFPEQKDS